MNHTDKKLRKLQHLLLIIATLSACHKPTHRKNEISKIEIATSGCLGTCPSIAISIDSSLVYKYYGGSYAKLKGYYTGRVTKGLWDTVNMKFREITHHPIHTNPAYMNADLPETELLIEFNKQKIHLYTDAYFQPDSVVKLFHWLEESFLHVKLSHSIDNLVFETTAQNPPPIPNVHNVKFPPPVLKHYRKN